MKLRILHTVQFYPPDNGGGATEVVRQVSERLALRGHDVTVATTRSPLGACSKLNGVSVESFLVRSPLNQSVLGITGEVDRFLRFLTASSFDVILNYAAQTWPTDLTFRVLGDLRSRTVLVPCGYSGLIFPRSLLYRGYFQRLPQYLRMYDSVVYHSGNYRDKAFGDAHGIRHYRIIPNGVGPLPAGSPLEFRNRFGITTPYMLLTVGNHVRGKRHDRVLSAMRRLRRKDVTLVIIGERIPNALGSCFRSCMAAASQSDGLIRYLSGLSRFDVLAAFQSADIFLSASSVEVFPLVIIEAMAAGCPFIAYPAGNIAELPGGLLVERPKEMAAVIEGLLSDESQRILLGRAGSAAQKLSYSWDHIVLEYEALYRELCLGGKRKGTAAPA